jgi:hypothetical protein
MYRDTGGGYRSGYMRGQMLNPRLVMHAAEAFGVEKRIPFKGRMRATQTLRTHVQQAHLALSAVPGAGRAAGDGGLSVVCNYQRRCSHMCSRHSVNGRRSANCVLK